MAQGPRRDRRARGLSIEPLEGRALLSGAALLEHGHPVAEVARPSGPRVQAPLTTIQGRLTGVVSQVATTGINTQFSAQGQVLRVGQVRLSGQQATNVGTTSIRAAGIGLFVLPKGQIVVSYSGASPITTRGNAPLNLAGSIIGGTGAYLHATGSFLGKVTYTNSARITVNFTLRLA